MSDTQTQSYNPAQKTSRRKLSVWVWLLALLVAFTALVGAVWAVGGPDQARSVLGLQNFSLPLFGSSDGGAVAPTGGRSAGASTTATDTSAATSSTLPAEAQQRMFVEQMESRVALTDLVSGRIVSLTLGEPVTTDTSAAVPLTGTYSNGSKISGKLTFAKLQDAWYFFSLTGRSDKQSGDVASPESFDSGVVSTITDQQAQAGTQDLITKGVIGGGFGFVKVESVKMGQRTATVDVTLSGGSEPGSKGRLVCISKTEAGTTYWFVASFEKR